MKTGNENEGLTVGQPAVDAASKVEGKKAPAACAHEKCSCKLAVEFWAERHGMLPEIHAGGALSLPADAQGQRSARVSLAMSGAVAPRGNPKNIHFKAAKLLHGWPIGFEATEAEFLAACEKAYGPKAEVVCR